MCGIVGLFTSGVPLERAALARAVGALGHRGPDGRGLWLSLDRRAALGHARLAVIDLKTGAQPIRGRDGSLRIVANGEFYGFERLRRACGGPFRTRSDSEVALRLYEERGPACLAALRGEFAFVIHDARVGEVFAARDRFGIKPLVYAYSRGRLWLASEAKALFAAGLPALWDERSFGHAVAHQYLPPDRTLFAGVRQLPPGHYLRWEPGSPPRLTRYWDIDFPLRDARPPADEHALTAELGRRLEEAVALRLRADVPVACTLSGGLDSSVVAALAARRSTKPLRCFSVGFADAAYDEAPAARATARFIGAELEPLRLSGRELLECLPAAAAAAESLAINAHLPAKYLLSRAVRDAGFKVVLTGEGSDEALAGYPHLRRDWILAGPRAGRERRLAELRGQHGVSLGVQLSDARPPRLPAVRRALGFVPSFLETKALMGRRLTHLLDRSFARRLRAADPFAALLSGIDVAGRLRGRHPVDQSSYLWTRLALANYILRALGDGTEMAHSIEGRVPYLDHEFFGLALTLPPALKLGCGTEKRALREAARGLIPESVRRRPKHPFLAPPLAADAAARTGIEETLRGRAFAAVPFFDRTRALRWLARLWRLPPARRAPHEPALMTALSAAALQAAFNPGAPR